MCAGLLWCTQKENPMNTQSFMLILVASSLATLFSCVNPDISTQPIPGQVTQATPPSAEAQSASKANRAIKLNNHHGIDQKVIVTQPKTDPTDCTQLHSKEFMDCMACQSSENLKNNLMNCNDRMAHYYFVNLQCPEEYYETLQNFSEKEWEEFYISRQSEMRENFPKTLEEQRNMLKLLYIYAYHNSNEYPHNLVEYMWCKNAQFKRDTLETIIHDFHERCSNGRINKTTHDHLHNSFYWERKKLFTKLAR